jgi:hypothetical protein
VRILQGAELGIHEPEVARLHGQLLRHFLRLVLKHLQLERKRVGLPG